MKPDEKQFPPSSVAINLGAVGANVKDGKTVADLRQRGNWPGSMVKDHHQLSFSPFKKPRFPVISNAFRELKHIFGDQKAKKIIYLTVFVGINISFLVSLCKESNSKALTAYTYLSILELAILFTCLLSIWVEQQRPNSSFTFGYGRFEVLAVFSSTVLGQLGSFFVIKECLERTIVQDNYVVEGSTMFFGTGISFLCHLLVNFCTESKAWTHVIGACKSNWIQRIFEDVSENLCQLIPGLSRFLLPRVNPFVLVFHLGAGSLIIAQFLIQLKSYYMADDIAAIFVAFLTWTTMYPMFIYTGLILLQTTPSHVLAHLDKCLREAATLDGVLEFRNEHFWTLSFGVMAGSIHVRVRRDANEQMVLSHLTNRLSGLISVLTIQVFKDDWTRSATTLQLLNDSARLTSGSFVIAPSALQSGPNAASSPHLINVPTFAEEHAAARAYIPATAAVGARVVVGSAAMGVSSGATVKTQAYSVLGGQQMLPSSGPQYQEVSHSGGFGKVQTISQQNRTSSLPML